MNEILSLADIGGTLAVVAMFIWYIFQVNGRQERMSEKNTEAMSKASEKTSMAMVEVAKSITIMTEAIERNTRVLIRVANNHNLEQDADDLTKL